MPGGARTGAPEEDPMRLRPAVSLAIVLLAVLMLPACSKKEEKQAPPLWEKLPPKVAVVKIGDWEISGAWLKNWCATQELLLLRQGLPFRRDRDDRRPAGVLPRLLCRMRQVRRGLSP